MYKVLKFFNDLQDGKHAYKAGDIFPRKGVEVSEERIEELLSANNKRHEPMIVLVPDPKPAPKPNKDADPVSAPKESKAAAKPAVKDDPKRGRKKNAD